LAARHTLRALRRLVQLVKNSARVVEKQPARRTELHAATEAVEQREPDLAFEILNLSRQRGLSHSQADRGATEMFLFANRHEVSKVTQFHSDTVSRLVR
jgi:hypothetical protein